MTKYWLISHSGAASHGVAYLRTELTGEAIPEFGDGPLRKWVPLEFDLRDGNATDYLNCNISIHLVSPRLREIFERHRGPLDELEFFDCGVYCNSSEPLAYYALYIPVVGDVLNPTESLMHEEGWPIKPVFNPLEVANRHVFSYRGAIFSLIVSNRMKIHLNGANIVGIDFETVPVR
ncbi:MAG: hypothetical protein IPH08_10470 [Rhodocyclaceae bacterium]|nr:hypothetical protein [Rhodocyclaceae bacterium]